MQGGFQHFHYIIGSDLTLFASNHTGTRLIHHRKPSGHQLPAALSLFARCWLNLATLLSVLKAFTAILYCTEIQYLLKYGRRSILFATATASMRAQSGPYLGVLDLTRTERHSSVLCVVWPSSRTTGMQAVEEEGGARGRERKAGSGSPAWVPQSRRAGPGALFEQVLLYWVLTFLSCVSDRFQNSPYLRVSCRDSAATEHRRTG